MLMVGGQTLSSEHKKVVPVGCEFLKKAVPLSCEWVPVGCEYPLHKHSGLVVNKGIRA